MSLPTILVCRFGDDPGVDVQSSEQAPLRRQTAESSAMPSWPAARLSMRFRALGPCLRERLRPGASGFNIDRYVLKDMLLPQTTPGYTPCLQRNSTELL